MNRGPKIGEMLAHYRVLDRLASGGMGEIYIAEDTRLDRRVALKVLPTAAVSDHEKLQRFRAEAKAIAAMNHPNIVTVHGVEEFRGIHFIAMELVDGKTLRELLSSGGLPLHEFLRIAEQLTEAVAVAHEAGITHRDLKPDNVMVTRTGHVKVLDFGLAKLVADPDGPPLDGETVNLSRRSKAVDLTEDGALLGTVPYMSPEHVAGSGVDHRSDLFSLGIILYEMLTGERPFKGDNSAAVMSSILRKTPEPISRSRHDTPKNIEHAIGLCLEKDPTQRMQSAMSLHEQMRITQRELSSGSGASFSNLSGSGSRPQSALSRSVARAGSSLRVHRAPLLLLGIVFMINLVETLVETSLRDNHGIGRELGFSLARAAHWFEGSVTLEAYDTATQVVVYGYSIAYFFILLALILVTGWSLIRKPDREPFRIFAVAVAADYVISLPFFLFFPVPERWAYPESGAILLSDLWAPKLIEIFRPISGLDNCFPSFHVSLTVVMVTIAFHYRLRFRWSALWLGFLVGLSTLVLGIHWLTDVVAGVAAGTLAATFALAMGRSGRCSASADVMIPGDEFSSIEGAQRATKPQTNSRSMQMRKMTVMCVLLGLLVVSGAAAEETVDEVIAKNIEAKGGKDAWMAVQTVRYSGKMIMGGGAMEAPFTAEFKRPGKVRLEFTMQGMTGVQAYDGETGWAVMPFLGKDKPEEMAEDQLKDTKEMAEFDGLLLNYEEKGHTVELLGTEEVDGTEAYKLQVTKASGDVVTMYLDAEYFVEFKTEEKREVQGNEMEISTVIGDYKEVDGLMFAHSMESAMGGMPAAQVIVIESIELGIDLPDDRFSMPAVDEEPAPE